MLWFYRYITGYIRVLFYGEFSERILNIAAQNRITLWNSHLVKKGIESNITVKNFLRLRTIMRKSKIRAHILYKKGLPFKLKKNQKRIGLLAGALIFTVILEVASGYIWVIDITGNQKVKSEEIIAACENIGIHTGVKKSKINPKNQREKLLLEFEKLAWASLNIEGCRLTVNVSEVKDIDKKEAPCNLKASGDGIIKKIDVTTGNCLVKVGDTVKKGDVLVSGVVERSDGTAFVCSTGTVIATTKRTVTVSGEYKKTVSYENGKTKTKRVLEFFNIKIPLYLGSEKAEFLSEFKTHNITLFDSKLPITVYEKNFKFINQEEITLSKEKLTKELEEMAEQKLKELKAESFTMENSEITETDKGLTLTITVVAEENIVYADPILVATEQSESK